MGRLKRGNYRKNIYLGFEKTDSGRIRKRELGSKGEKATKNCEVRVSPFGYS